MRICLVKECNVSQDLASGDKLFRSMARLYLKLLFKNSLFGFGSARSVSLFLRL